MLPANRTPPPTGPPCRGRLEERVRARIPQPRSRYPPLGAAVLSHYFGGVRHNAREVERVRAAVPTQAIHTPAAAAWKDSP
jgi:hypothetical protein